MKPNNEDPARVSLIWMTKVPTHSSKARVNPEAGVVERFLIDYNFKPTEEEVRRRRRLLASRQESKADPKGPSEVAAILQSGSSTTVSVPQGSLQLSTSRVLIQPHSGFLHYAGIFKPQITSLPS
ncbi:unnamed protein product [Schistocephalus solidus]|uniref:DET1- and DDB1-associated protein 1 n=1 Tax=Schistocephalus solidus TaxID=70667 RepID=A0A183TKZ0_SCHSO|nr:unnamed protein product [Schistocephalus solidus]